MNSLNSSNKECIILIGIQGAGKSTFCAQYFFDTHVRINLDMLRTRNRERRIFESCLEATQSCVIDNTNTTIEERQKYIESAKENGFSVVGYYLRSSISECLSRNSRREGHKRIPNSAISSRYNKMEIPSISEGFDKLYYVSIVNGEFSIVDFSEEIEKDKIKSHIVTRRISVPVLDRIDWESIVESLAWEKDIAFEIKEAPNTKRPLVLLELVGDLSKISEFSKEVHDKIEEAINKEPFIIGDTVHFKCFRWSNKDFKAELEARNMGIKIVESRIIKSWFQKIVVFEIVGEAGRIKKYIEKISL